MHISIFRQKIDTPYEHSFSKALELVDEIFPYFELKSLSFIFLLGRYIVLLSEATLSRL